MNRTSRTPDRVRRGLDFESMQEKNPHCLSPINYSMAKSTHASPISENIDEDTKPFLSPGLRTRFHKVLHHHRYIT